jgi:hypothetical protein
MDAYSFVSGGFTILVLFVEGFSNCRETVTKLIFVNEREVSLAELLPTEHEEDVILAAQKGREIRIIHTTVKALSPASFSLPLVDSK